MARVGRGHCASRAAFTFLAIWLTDFKLSFIFNWLIGVDGHEYNSFSR